MTYIDDRLLGDRLSRKYNISESIVRRRSEATNNRVVTGVYRTRDYANKSLPLGIKGRSRDILLFRRQNLNIFDGSKNIIK